MFFSNSFDSLLGKSADVEFIDIESWQKIVFNTYM